MNLEESDSFMQENERNEKKKKAVLVLIGLCVILVVLLLILIFTIQYQDSKTLKVFLDGSQYKFSSNFFKTVDEATYVNIKEAASLYGYTYQNGEYKKYNEDENSCYIGNGIETVALTGETSSFTKYIDTASGDKITLANQEITVKNLEGYSETFNTNYPIKLIDGEIYVPFENLPDIFNTYIDLSKENRIKLYSLGNRFAKIVELISTSNTKYTQVSGEYENIKALAYGLAVVSQGENNFGVISSLSGEEIIGPKYSQMQFVQNSKEFLVNAENTVGLISKEGSTIIPPTEYDEISILDDKIGIYMVKKDKQYGVLNRDGEVVIYVEYDSIGLKNVEEYSADQIKNGTILFGSSIPVSKDGKYGLYATDGTEQLAAEYSKFGCILEEKESSSEKSVLLIPEEIGIHGIVVGSDKGYGVYDVNAGRWVISDVCSKIFSKTKLGETTYYVEYNGVQMDLEQYLEENNLKSFAEDGTNLMEVSTSTEPVENSNNVTEGTNTTNQTNEIEEVVTVE